MEDNFWNDTTVKEMIYSKLPIPKHYCGDLQKCLDEFKASKQQSVSKDKDWEIVSYKAANDGGIICSSPLADYACKNSPNHEIFSVRRLSDNLVFSVGDEISDMVDDYYMYKSISSFAVDNGKMYVIMKDNKGFSPFEYIYKKGKQPLFKTEDGKDIYEGDSAFYVQDENNFMVVSHFGITHKSPHKYFATEAAAKDYVVMKTPCLSVYDVIENWKDRSAGVGFIEGIKKLVEQKINNQ